MGVMTLLYVHTFRAVSRAPDTAMSVVWIFDWARWTQRHTESFRKSLKYWWSSTAHWSIGPALLLRNTPPLP